MSEVACHVLALIYDPRIHLHMQLANREVDETLGLTHNVPILVGDITLYIQFHIVCNPAYDVLLGRPFDNNPRPELWKNRDGAHLPAWYSLANCLPEPGFL